MPPPRRAEVPQPPSTDDEHAFEALTEWWKRHGDKIKLHDPWLEFLAKQKVD
jgi:hypothetical protein